MARKAGITRDQVIEAASVIADREGLPAVSLAAVAGALGVRSPSLYAHIEGLSGLRRALAFRAMDLLAQAFMTASEPGREPVVALRAIAHAYRAFAHEHPGLYAALSPAPLPQADPDAAAAAAQPVQVIAAALTELDLPPEHHIDVIRAFRALLHGFVDLELSHDFGLADPVDASFDAAVDLFLNSLTNVAFQAQSS